MVGGGEYSDRPRLSLQPGDSMGTSDPSRSPRPSNGRKRGVVLLVADEEKVRWIARRVLEADGWEVLEAADGEAALQLIGEREGRLDLGGTALKLPPGKWP